MVLVFENGKVKIQKCFSVLPRASLTAIHILLEHVTKRNRALFEVTSHCKWVVVSLLDVGYAGVVVPVLLVVWCFSPGSDCFAKIDFFEWHQDCSNFLDSEVHIHAV